MLRLIKWLFLLTIVGVALVVGLLFSKDAIAKAAVEQQLRAQTGMDVKIGKFSLSVWSPIATIENLTLANPADFGGIPFLNIRELHMEFDREALAHREVRLKLLKLNIAELTVVRNDRGETNLVVFAAAPKPAKNSDNFDFKGIAVANFSVSKVTLWI
jgi:AsmA protein